MGLHILDYGSTAYYLFYLGSELILIDIRNPFLSSTCLVRYSWFLSSCGVRACESPPKRGLYATMRRCASHGCVSYKRASHRRTLQRRASHGRAPHGHVPHGRVPHGLTPHGRVPHGRTCWAKEMCIALINYLERT